MLCGISSGHTLLAIIKNIFSNQIKFVYESISNELLQCDTEEKLYLLKMD